MYTSSDAHTAYCEILKQVSHPMLIPSDAKLLKIDCPKWIDMEEVDEAKLDPSWSDDARGPRICRPIGDDWLSSGRTVLLKVPSAARPGFPNYLINPSAFRAQDISVAEVIDQPFGPSVMKAQNSL